MKADEIFQKSVSVMKELLPRQEVLDSIQRARSRTDEENLGLVERERENINEIVRRIVDAKGSGDALAEISQELKDAMVIRYIKNRDIFIRTFPDGIENIDPDPLAVWAAIMISPLDEREAC